MLENIDNIRAQVLKYCTLASIFLFKFTLSISYKPISKYHNSVVSNTIFQTLNRHLFCTMFSALIAKNQLSSFYDFLPVPPSSNKVQKSQISISNIGEEKLSYTILISAAESEFWT